MVWSSTGYGLAIVVLTPGYSLGICNGRCVYQLFHRKEPAYVPNVNWIWYQPHGFDNSLYYGRNWFSWRIDMPLWPFVAIAIGTTAAAWRIDAIARRKSRSWACTNCGYDRTGLAANAPCPECNTKA